MNMETPQIEGAWVIESLLGGEPANSDWTELKKKNIYCVEPLRFENWYSS